MRTMMASNATGYQSGAALRGAGVRHVLGSR